MRMYMHTAKAITSAQNECPLTGVKASRTIPPSCSDSNDVFFELCILGLALLLQLLVLVFPFFTTLVFSHN